MKAKTINAVVSRKINDWLNSIEDKELVQKIKSDIIISGGAITSMLLNETVNDFDIYFKTKESLKAICEYYANQFNKNNEGKMNKLGKPLHAWVLDGDDVEKWKNNEKSLSSFAFNYKDISYSEIKGWNYENENENKSAYLNISGMLLNTLPDRIKVMVNSDGVAEDSDEIADKNDYSIDAYLDAISDGDEISSDSLEEKSPENKYKPIFLSTNAITLSNKIQIVVRFYGDVDVIHKNYDFVHATNYWTFATGTVLNQRALESILNKELFYIGSKYPICSLVRIRKFIKRGWQINAGQFVKMSFQISELNLKDIYVLEDQLVGVDSIYFLNFIQNLKRKQIEDNSFVLTQDYLTTVIDKIFG
ncbi:MAG TPA: hypothetical protein VIK86_04780 [Candidatus Paceibacterota bacterium]